MALLSASLLTLTSRSSIRLKRRRCRTTEAPPRPSGRRGRISERPQRPELTTLPLQSRPNASPFWIMLLLVRRQNRQGVRVKVPNDERVANDIGPESCAAAREGRREALTGVRSGWPLSRESKLQSAGPISDSRFTPPPLS